MKIRNIWWLVPAAVMLGACSKKEEPATPQAPVPEETTTEAAPPPVEVPPEPAVAALSPEERAAKLGFARHLPQDTGVVLSLHNGSRHASRIKSSKLWQLISSEMGMDFDDEFEDEDDDFGGEELPDDGANGPAALFASEFTIAVGREVGAQTSNLITLGNRLTHIQMRTLAKAVADAAEEGDFSDIGSMLSQRFNEELFKQLLEDPESGVALFEQMKMPPLYLAFGTTPENRGALAQQLASSTETLAFFLEDVIEPVEVERNGETFAGNKILGAKIAESMAEDRESIEEMLDSALVDRLIAAVAKKDLVVMSGLAGDYAVFFIGASEDDLVFAENLGESLVAGDALAFYDAYASKDLAALIYGEKGAISRMYENITMLADYAGGLREGLAGTEGLGDTRDLETLLRLVGERESALRTLEKIEATGTVAFIEEGLKIESFGGVDNGSIDWQATNRLASLVDTPNIAVFTNMTAGQAYNDLTRSYLEALTETAYALAMKVAELPFEDEIMLQYREMAGMFDRMFRRDAVALWEALSGDFSAGLGKETALVVDLNGSPPPIPGVPQNVVDEARFPRISMVAPVTERAKLASAWQKIDATATGILAKISEMTDTAIPMQKPLDSERDGFTTWFFQMPFFTNEFMPSVTVGDEWFAASTSRNQSLDLLARAGSGDTSTGLSLIVNFDALREFVTETVALIGKNPELVPLDEDDVDQFRKVVDALEDLEKFSLHSRMEAGQVRTSIHLKIR